MILPQYSSPRLPVKLRFTSNSRR